MSQLMTDIEMCLKKQPAVFQVAVFQREPNGDLVVEWEAEDSCPIMTRFRELSPTQLQIVSSTLWPIPPELMSSARDRIRWPHPLNRVFTSIDSSGIASCRLTVMDMKPGNQFCINLDGRIFETMVGLNPLLQYVREP